MTSCVSSDITKFSTGESTIGSCIAQSVDGSSTMIPAGSVIKTCLSAAGVSTKCSACWGNLFDSIKTCMVDTCGFPMSGEGGAAPPPMDQPPNEQCIQCMMNMSGSLMQSGDSMTICGIDPQAMGAMGDNVRNQLGQWMGDQPMDDQPLGEATDDTATDDSTTKSAPRITLKSMTTLVFVAALLMVNVA